MPAAELSQLELKREAEWRLCRKDPLYFLEKYWKIETVGVGYGDFKLREYQVEDARAMLDAMQGRALPRQVRLKARQIGWTTLACGMAMWDVLFHNNHPWIIASVGEDEAKDTLDTRLKIPYSYLPKWMRDRAPALIKETGEEMKFDNQSRILSIPSTSSAGRGKAVYGVLMDEAAFVENADELFAALDPMTYGPLFMFSTANGMGNFFHETWQESLQGDSEWGSAFRPWSAVPERDAEWHKRTQKKYRTRPYLFFQEYPATPEEAFLKSGNTALNMEAIRELDFEPPLFRYDLALLNEDDPDWSRMVDAMLIPEGEERDLELWVWELPSTERDEHNRLVRQPNYVVGVDVAEGLDDGDYSAIAVEDVNAQQIVATMRAHVPVEDLGRYVAWIGYWYYVALVGVERNNMGLVPLQHLQQNGYPRLFRMDTIAQQKRGDRTPRYGYHTNKATKPKMVVDFNKLLRSQVLLLHDDRFLHEAGTFISDGKGGYGASSGNHDDLVMAVLIAHQLALDVGQYPPIWRDPEKGPLTIGDLIRLGLERQEAAEPVLAQPIGQGRFSESSVKSFWR